MRLHFLMLYVFKGIPKCTINLFSMLNFYAISYILADWMVGVEAQARATLAGRIRSFLTYAWM
jgi:hypothetical protein